ncbi:hypothetical protein [Rhodohalobacter sp. 8-1]|uniref:hypothetical protein n=1 Tax=Rhodohalobacter sp. 8-1 TaxID=3131972 RepID=UPI0030EEC944
MYSDHIYSDQPDYLEKERINLLLKHGYYGYKVKNIEFDDHRGQLIAVAQNINGNTLSAYGETKEDACIQLIDLIGITLDTL